VYAHALVQVDKITEKAVQKVKQMCWSRHTYSVCGDNLPRIIAQKPCTISCKRKRVLNGPGFELKVVSFVMWLFAAK